MKLSKNAFTLVELIVVVTILAILATIGFVSYSSYLTWVRDTNRLAQLVSISDGLELYRTTKDLPLPDDSVEVSINGSLIAYQGTAWSNTLETIDFTKGWVDPRDGTYFSYYLTKDRKHYQLLWFLEEEASITSQNTNILPTQLRGIEGELSLVQETQAVSYDNRIPTVYGRKLWILTDDQNTPVEQAWADLDITAATTWYIAHMTDTETLSWSSLQSINPKASCKRIKQLRWWSSDWVYEINPTWVEDAEFDVYCDMTTDWWGWALVDNIANNSDTMWTRTAWVNLDLWTTKWSLLPSHAWSSEAQLLCKADHYSWSKNWVTFNVLTDKAKQYPTTAATAIWNTSSGDYSAKILNGNTYYYLGYPWTDTWLWHWYSSGMWLWYGSSSTCSCGYGANSWVWWYSSTIRICSTWVR